MAHRAKHRRENWVPERRAASEARMAADAHRQDEERKEREAARG